LQVPTNYYNIKNRSTLSHSTCIQDMIIVPIKKYATVFFYFFNKTRKSFYVVLYDDGLVL